MGVEKRGLNTIKGRAMNVSSKVWIASKWYLAFKNIKESHSTQTKYTAWETQLHMHHSIRQHLFLVLFCGRSPVWEMDDLQWKAESMRIEGWRGRNERSRREKPKKFSITRVLHYVGLCNYVCLNCLSFKCSLTHDGILMVPIILWLSCSHFEVPFGSNV